MSKEYLEALDWLEEKCYVESPQAEKFEECCKIIRQSLHRLESIDDAKPSTALELVYLIKDYFSNMIPYQDWINDIEKYILKTQELEKEKLFFKNIHNTKVKTPLVSIFEGLSKDERFKITEHIYYNWEEMKEALEEQNKQLVEENIELKKKLNNHYLKWEELNFDVPATIKVKMGDTQYLLSLRIGLTGVKSVVLRDDNLKPYLHLYEKEKQFFNDLKLERVE